MKIIFKFFRYDTSFNFMTNLCLYLDYKRNLKFLKKKFNLSTFNKILYLKVNFCDLNKKSEQKCERDSSLKFKNLPDFNKEINDIKDRILQRKIYSLKTKIKKYMSFLNLKYLIDLKNSQNNIKKFFDFLSKHITTYKMSIQEIVEGQREVTQNKNFTFDDGETVKEKMDKFENKLKEHLNVQSQIDNIKKNIKKNQN
jgi:hypothetical protein